MFAQVSNVVNGAGRLPAWRCVLAVVAHPDDESFGLGAILAGFADQGTVTGVLCLTHGEASTLHGADGQLRDIRARELAAAAQALDVSTVELLNYPDGQLADTPAERLAVPVAQMVQRTGAEGLLVFDPAGVTGHPDHQQTTAAALAAATRMNLPVLGWTLPADVADTLNTEYATSFVGQQIANIDLVVSVDRRRQYEAIRRHTSQALPASVLWRRLELLGPYEYLRWLRRGEPPAAARN